METLFHQERNNILFFLISGMSLIFLNFFVKKKEVQNLTAELTIGFGLLIAGLFSLYHHIKSKRIFFDQLSTIINDPDNINGAFILEIDIHSVRMAGPSFSFTQKWSNIIDYTEFKNYIFLFIDKHQLDTIGVSKDHLSPEECSELMSFLKGRFDNKRIPY
jgi:hypothetical protein